MLTSAPDDLASAPAGFELGHADGKAAGMDQKSHGSSEAVPSRRRYSRRPPLGTKAKLFHVGARSCAMRC
jgi:hypothetical protein